MHSSKCSVMRVCVCVCVCWRGPVTLAASCCARFPRLRAEEVMAPYYYFLEAGCSVTIASIKGGEIPMDEASLNPPFVTKEVEKFILDGAARYKY